MISDEGRLVSGAAPASPDDLLERLEQLGIESRTVGHEAVFTVEQSKSVRGELTGGFTKNLFLRNKKGRMWLLVCAEDRQLDLRSLGTKLGAGRLSFASPERLMKYLGVIPGAVTPFAVINDVERQVAVVIDREVLEQEPLHFHPLDNAMTTTIRRDDLVRFLVAEGHPPTILGLD